MSVKRYSLDQDYDRDRYASDPSPSMEESPIGAYVLHSDFAALAAENEGLRKALIEADWLVGQLFPGIGSLAIQDYSRINTAGIAIREALSRKAAP